MRIGEICEFVYGDSLPKQNRIKGEFPVYGSNGQIDFHNKSLTKSETIIVGRKGSIGEVHFSRIGCWVIDTAYYVKPLLEINIQYLYFLLKTLNLSKLNKASSIPGLNRDDVYKIEVNLHSLDEQKRIIKIVETKLTGIEKAKIASDEQMVNCDLIKDKIYVKIFEEYSNWKNVNLEDLCLIERGGSPRPIENFTTKDPNGINWIKIGDARVDSKYIDSTNERIINEGSKHSRKVKKGDFILSNSMSFGRPYILNIDGCIHDGWLVFSDFSSIINKDYLYHVLSSSIIKKQFENAARGAIVRNLNIDIVKKVKIPLPGIKEQKQIVELIESKFNAVERVNNVLSEQSVYINALPSSILRKAFNGDY